jgi:DNA-binding transcriptional MerR regulator
MRGEMPQEYTITDLAKLAGVTPRTVRYYVAQGLLTAPGQAGPGARYTDAHLDRLRLIKKLQAAHLPLAEIRAQLGRVPDEQIEALAAEAPAPPGTALDYIRQVLSPPRVVGKPPTLKRQFAIPLQPPAVTPASVPGPAAPAGQPPAPAPLPASTTSQWERVTLHPDIELHVRRPLTRQLNKRVEQLIQIARSLFEEE